MGRSDFLKLGDWNVICDRCGKSRKASDCRYTWDELFVCSDKCWEPRQQQDFVVGIPDHQSVPIARPDVENAMGSTTVLTTATRNATSIDITSISGLVDDDPIGIEMDGGAMHWTFINGTPAGNTVILGSYLPLQATAGNEVLLPSLDNETHITASGITATGL